MKVNIKVEKLEQLQRTANLSEIALAKKIGVNRTTIYRVKKGKSSPGEDFIAGILKAFPRVKFDELFFLGQVSPEGHNDERTQADPCQKCKKPWNDKEHNIKCQDVCAKK